MTEDEKFAMRLALDNEYITTMWEFELFQKAILEAIEWGKMIDKRNKQIHDKGIFNNC